MNNPATTADARLTRYASDPTLETWLNASWRALQRELPALATWITAEQVSLEDAADAVIAATLRVMRNPEGAEEESTSLDDYAERTKRSDATEDIYFTAAELRRLRPDAAMSGDWSGSVKYS